MAKKRKTGNKETIKKYESITENKGKINGNGIVRQCCGSGSESNPFGSV
jgi:hypothetical protein